MLEEGFVEGAISDAWICVSFFVVGINVLGEVIEVDEICGVGRGDSCDFDTEIKGVIVALL